MSNSFYYQREVQRLFGEGPHQILFEIGAIHGSHFLSQFISSPHEHVCLRGNYQGRKQCELSSFPLGIAYHFENTEAPVVIQRVSFLNGHLFVVAQRSKPGFWETKQCGSERDSVPHMLSHH